MGNDETLGGRLRARRAGQGLTLSEVAEKADLSIQYVSNLERGRGNPTLEALQAIAAALEIDLAGLLGTDEAATDFDLTDLVLADAPPSLTSFSRSERFRSVAERLADSQESSVEDMHRRLLVGMASAPRRSAGEPTEDDWRRLLDVYRTILTED